MTDGKTTRKAKSAKAGVDVGSAQAARRSPGRPSPNVAGGDDVSRLTGQPGEPGDASSEKSQVNPPRGNASRRAPAAPGKAKAVGRVVAIGVDVPTVSELEAEEAAPKARGRGRPDEYQPRYAGIARGMCRLGASDLDLAREFDVNTSTIWYWRSKHEDFSNALLEGKEAFDDRIERSLAMKAAGYTVHVEKVYCSEGQIVRAQTVEHYPPDVGAIKLWLGNRRPDKWKDKQEVKMDGSDAFLKVWQAISNGTA